MKRLSKEIKVFEIPRSFIGKGDVIVDQSNRLITSSKLITQSEKEELLSANKRRCSAEWGYIRKKSEDLIAEREDKKNVLRYRDQKMNDVRANFCRVSPTFKELVILLYTMGYSQKAIERAIKYSVSETTIGKIVEDCSIEMERKGYKYKRVICIEMLEQLTEDDIRLWRHEHYSAWKAITRPYTQQELRELRDLYKRGFSDKEAAMKLRRGLSGVSERYRNYRKEEIIEGIEYYEKS